MEGSCNCGVEIYFIDTNTSPYTVPTPSSPMDGQEYWYMVRNKTAGELTVKYKSFTGDVTFKVPSGQIGEVSMLYLNTAGTWITRCGITEK